MSGADGLRCLTKDGMHFTAPDSELHNFTFTGQFKFSTVEKLKLTPQIGQTALFMEIKS